MTARSGCLLGALQAIHVLALALWLAAIISVGVAATAVFTMLPRTELMLPRFEEYVQQAHGEGTPALRAREYGRIAGGQVMDPVFRMSDRAQALLALVALISLVGWMIESSRCTPARTAPAAARWVALARLACIFAAGALLAWQLLLMAPRMDAALHEWWRAAEAADPTAAGFRAAFDEDHLLANRLYTLRLPLVVAALLMAAASPAWPQRGCRPPTT